MTRNWLLGWYIVEYEQRGACRAKYGARLLAKVSRRLQVADIKGCSTTLLKLCRQFHQPEEQKGVSRDLGSCRHKYGDEPSSIAPGHRSIGYRVKR